MAKHFEFTGDVNALPKTLGGGAVHADLKMPRFMPQDFHLGTDLEGAWSGTSFADWPVDYDMLDPFYLYIERLIGIQGLDGSDPFAGKRSAPYPMPPGVPMYVALKVAEGAKKLGYSAFPYPTAVNSRPYLGRPACVDCGYCSGYACPSHAKGAPPVKAPADRIFLLPTSPLDLTGVASYEVFLRGTLDKAGAYPDFLHIGDYKTAVNQLTEKGFTPRVIG